MANWSEVFFITIILPIRVGRILNPNICTTCELHDLEVAVVRSYRILGQCSWSPLFMCCLTIAKHKGPQVNLCIEYRTCAVPVGKDHISWYRQGNFQVERCFQIPHRRTLWGTSHDTVLCCFFGVQVQASFSYFNKSFTTKFLGK